MLSFHSWRVPRESYGEAPLESRTTVSRPAVPIVSAGQDENGCPSDIVPASSPDDRDAPIDAGPVQIIEKVRTISRSIFADPRVANAAHSDLGSPWSSASLTGCRCSRLSSSVQRNHRAHSRPLGSRARPIISKAEHTQSVSSERILSLSFLCNNEPLIRHHEAAERNKAWPWLMRLCGCNSSSSELFRCMALFNCVGHIPPSDRLALLSFRIDFRKSLSINDKDFRDAQVAKDIRQPSPHILSREHRGQARSERAYGQRGASSPPSARHSIPRVT